jgi:gas vesicle protein
MESGKITLGLLAGLATGAILGILFAPDKGTETRKKITGKCNEYADEVNAKINGFATSINEKIEDAKSSTQDMIADAKSKMVDAKKEILG